jgi:hypothetical protein
LMVIADTYQHPVVMDGLAGITGRPIEVSA